MIPASPNYHLTPQHIDIWLCHLNKTTPQNPIFLPQLSPEEQTRAARFKFDIHRNRFITSHGFMRTILAKYLNTQPANIHYQKGEQGKPALLSADANGLEFNLSHTQDIAILAITKNAAVGIDIEHNDRKTDWKGICKRFFTEEEQGKLFALPENQQGAAFFDLWTRKEAYMKVMGTGLALSPTQFTLTVFPEEPGLVRHDSMKFAALKVVDFVMIDLPESADNYCATVALGDMISSYHIYEF